MNKEMALISSTKSKEFFRGEEGVWQTRSEPSPPPPQAEGRRLKTACAPALARLRWWRALAGAERGWGAKTLERGNHASSQVRAI